MACFMKFKSYKFRDDELPRRVRNKLRGSERPGVVPFKFLRARGPGIPRDSFISATAKLIS
jgi:hypothetical protein